MFKKILDYLKDAHIPIGIGVFVTGAALAWHGLISPPFVAFTSTVFGFLGAHHYVENAVKDQNNQNNN